MVIKTEPKRSLLVPPKDMRVLIDGEMYLTDGEGTAIKLSDFAAMPDSKERQKRKPSGNAKAAITLRLSQPAYKRLMEEGGRSKAEAILEASFAQAGMPV